MGLPDPFHRLAPSALFAILVGVTACTGV